MAADGSGAWKVTSDAGHHAALAWSPDGTRIAFMSLGAEPGDWEIAVVHVASGDTTRLTRHAARDSHPVWSPDGQRIAFSSDRRGARELFFVDAGGGTPAVVSAERVLAEDPAWSPDGRRIAFASGAYGSRSILMINADGASLRALLDGDSNTLSTAVVPR
jgi:TolB protein